MKRGYCPPKKMKISPALKAGLKPQKPRKKGLGLKGFGLIELICMLAITGILLTLVCQKIQHKRLTQLGSQTLNVAAG